MNTQKQMHHDGTIIAESIIQNFAAPNESLLVHVPATIDGKADWHVYAVYKVKNDRVKHLPWVAVCNGNTFYRYKTLHAAIDKLKTVHPDAAVSIEHQYRAFLARKATLLKVVNEQKTAYKAVGIIVDGDMQPIPDRERIEAYLKWWNSLDEVTSTLEFVDSKQAIVTDHFYNGLRITLEGLVKDGYHHGFLVPAYPVVDKNGIKP